MKHELPIEELLRWRLARAESQASRAPRGARLLELARPWWETWPEHFRSLAQRLGRIQMAYGHAMTEPGRAGTGHAVPSVIVRAAEESEASARMLYLNVRDGRLRLRFQLDAATERAAETFEVTFVADVTGRPLLSAQATLSMDSEYRIDTELSAEVARAWESLKVTDRMPFRLILRVEQEPN